ncbi:MAG: DUF2520 domain-containing protein [Flavobacteriaceae bacterium]|nr:DUF2520 domain-containing protein [Flavobacteriaceae bacterium]
MIRIGLIGTGNVATALAREIRDHKTLTLVQLIGRGQNKLPKDLITVPFSDQFNALPTCDMILIAVSDHAIQEVSNLLPLTDAIVAHTSGASSIDLLSKHKHRGVFYPLQTFSKQQQLNWFEIPILWEGNNKQVNEKLETISQMISQNPVQSDEKQRLSMHLAAVVVNNFTNHLYAEAHRFCKSKQLNFDLLAPLIEETTRKIKQQDPRESQTGPASRADMQTIQRHKTIPMTKELSDIYSLFTSQLLNRNNENI